MGSYISQKVDDHVHVMYVHYGDSCTALLCSPNSGGGD